MIATTTIDVAWPNMYEALGWKRTQHMPQAKTDGGGISLQPRSKTEVPVYSCDYYNRPV
jgi:hypothetical protein